MTLLAGGVRRPVGEVRALHGHAAVPHRHDGLRRRVDRLERRSLRRRCVFDEFPFIFLTLMLSLQASYAAPLILLAQNRQADRDRVALEQDRSRDERNLADTEFLTREVASLRLALREQATRDFVRSELRDLLERARGAGDHPPPRRRSRLAAAPPRLDPATHPLRDCRPLLQQGPALDERVCCAVRSRRRTAPRSGEPAQRHTMEDMSVPALPSRDAMLTALSKVNDPEIRKPITELGMVKSVEIDDAGQGRPRDLPHRLGLPDEGDADHVTRRQRPPGCPRRRHVGRGRARRHERRAARRAAPTAARRCAREGDPLRQAQPPHPGVCRGVGQGRRGQVVGHRQPRRRDGRAGAAGRGRRRRRLRLLRAAHARRRAASHAGRRHDPAARSRTR